MHTKGPWKAEELDTARNGFKNWKTFTVRSPQNVCLATVGDVDRYHESDHADNSRLIAAAPELLEACKWAAQIIGKVVADDMLRDIAMPRFPVATLERLENAIAKAEGR
jgi:hypothetical protein